MHEAVEAAILSECKSDRAVWVLACAIVHAAIAKVKRRKAPGPDDLPIEFFKELDEQHLGMVLKIFDDWWYNNHIPQDELQATVVLIFKKGNTKLLENYRPISLLNTLYKLFAYDRGLVFFLYPLNPVL